MQPSHIAQVLIIVWVVIILLSSLWGDVNGRTAREPYGFSGIIGSLIGTALLVYTLYRAGAFSTF